eukprot:gene9771-20318_t
MKKSKSQENRISVIKTSRSMELGLFKPLPNPLDHFPSKSETLSHLFMTGEDVRGSSRARKQWLDPSHIDPNFGVKGGNKANYIRKAFRRLESSQLFIPPKNIPNLPEIPSLSNTTHNHHLTTITATTTSKKKNFIAVEESRLEELIRFEHILRQERKELGNQCSWLMKEEQMSARYALPALRLAVYNICETEMRHLSAKMMEINNLWEKYCIKQHYGKIRLHNKNSYIQSLPLTQRAHKLLELQEEDTLWKHSQERDNMLYEDDISLLINKYINAQDIRTDYDQYYILANRYGIFDEDNYTKAPLPGKRYFEIINISAYKIQNRWHCYWPMQKLKRHKRARKIQTIWRCHRSYKKFHPIHVFRKQMFKKNIFSFYMNIWKKYHKIKKIIYRMGKFRDGVWVPKCFRSWRRWIDSETARKDSIMKKIIVRMRSIILISSITTWKHYKSRIKHLKTFSTRVITEPIFKNWIIYKKYSLHVKLLNSKAIVIQSYIRGFLARKQWEKQKKAAQTIGYFGLIVLARKKRKEKLKKNIDLEFEKWLPGELERQMNRANEREKKRLLHQQKVLIEMEKSALEELQKHLASRDGKLQLQHIINDNKVIAVASSVTPNGGVPIPIITQNIKEEKLKITKLLLEQCSQFCRPIHKHDFNAKNPLSFYCADITCGAVFSTEIQYHNHMKYSEKHQGKPPQYSTFHVMLRTKKGQQAVRNFIMRVEGIGAVANGLDLWVAIQEWSKVLSKSDKYISKTLFIYENFLRDHSNRPINIEYENKDILLTTIERVKHREYEGFYKLHRGPPTGVRNMLGMSGEQYESWTTENIIPGDLFEILEWKTFLFLFNSLQNHNFDNSDEAAVFRSSLVEIEKRQREAFFQDFLQYREMQMKRWTEDFIFEDTQRGNFADHVLEFYINIAVNTEINHICKRAASEIAFIAMQKEQKEVETIVLFLDDAMYWCTSNIIDELYEFYISILLNTMLEKKEFRKILFKFAEIIEPEIIQENKVEVEVEEDAPDDTNFWFSQFIEAAIHEETHALPIVPDVAATMIQKRVRGMLGRKIARRIFVTVYGKR